LDKNERQKINIVSKYVIDSFTQGDWLTLGQITGRLDDIQSHARLLRSMYFGDDDYESCATGVLSAIFENSTYLINEVIEFFSIDQWYKQQDPEKFNRIFQRTSYANSDFWIPGYIRLFVSHLSSNKKRVSDMKSALFRWGISSFVAHEDIEPTREWQEEIEAALESMDIMLAVVEPGFKDSDWCAQEIGYSLGRKVDIISLRVGMDPFGFFGKYQGLQIKGRMPSEAANDVAAIIMRKPKFREKMLAGMAKSLSSMDSREKIETVGILDSWSIVTEVQLKELLEGISLSDSEKVELDSILNRVGAFKNYIPF